MLNIRLGHQIAGIDGGLGPPSASGQLQQLWIHLLHQLVLHQARHVEQLRRKQDTREHAKIDLNMDGLLAFPLTIMFWPEFLKFAVLRQSSYLAWHMRAL